jgi:hypothetical protein
MATLTHQELKVTQENCHRNTTLRRGRVMEHEYQMTSTETVAKNNVASMI